MNWDDGYTDVKGFKGSKVQGFKGSKVFRIEVYMVYLGLHYLEELG